MSAVFLKIKLKLKAESLIRQQLAIKETPDLYCSLGEVTKDIQYFIKAIELSKGKSARAYRMLAKFQFHKEQVGIYKANLLVQLKTKNFVLSMLMQLLTLRNPWK